jgi:hypothetical protein
MRPHLSTLNIADALREIHWRGGARAAIPELSGAYSSCSPQPVDLSFSADPDDLSPFTLSLPESPVTANDDHVVPFGAVPSLCLSEHSALRLTYPSIQHVSAPPIFLHHSICPIPVHFIRPPRS